MSKVTNILEFKRPVASVKESQSFAEAVVAMALTQPDFHTKHMVLNGFDEVNKLIDRAMTLRDEQLIEILDRMGFLDPTL